MTKQIQAVKKNRLSLEDIIMADIMEAVEQGREDYEMGRYKTIEELEEEIKTWFNEDE